MYGEPSCFRHAMRIGLPRARNASTSSSFIPPTLPRQVVSSAIASASFLVERSGLLLCVGQTTPEPAGTRPARDIDDCDQADRPAPVRGVPRPRPVHADPRARRARDDDGRRAPAVLRRVEPADARLHRRGGGAGARGRPHLLLRERGPPVAAARDRRSVPAPARRRARPEREIVVTASGLQALHLAIRSVIDPGRRGDHPLAGLAERRGNRRPLARRARRGPARARRRALRDRLRRARGGARPAARVSSCSPRRRTRSAGSPRVDEQRRLLDLCRERGLWLLADEVYERIYYDGEPRRSGSLDPAPLRPRRSRSTSSSRSRRATA